jgi:threonyl-tRNA synthetase
LTVSEKSEPYCREVEAKLKAVGLRTSGDYRGVKLSPKIRDAQVELIPYMFVVGEKDRDAGTVTVRDRIDGDLGPMPLSAAVEKLESEIAAKTVRQTVANRPPVAADHHSQNEY